MSVKQKKISLKAKADKITNVCGEIVKLREWTKQNMEELTELFIGRIAKESIFKRDVEHYMEKFDQNQSLFKFYYKLDNKNKKKYIDFYSEKTGNKEIFEIVEFAIEMYSQLYNDDCGGISWFKLLDYDEEKDDCTKTPYFYTYEIRLFTNKVSKKNKGIIYDSVMNNIEKVEKE